MRYACIDRRRSLYPVRMMCDALKVSASGYYDWQARPESPRARYDRQLTKTIRQVHAESDGTYGSPRVHAELNATGHPCGRPKVARLMHLAGLKGCPKRRFRVTTKSGMTRARNLLGAGLLCRDNERTLGLRHHLPVDRTGLVVPGCRYGSVLATHHWLVHESAH